MIFMKKIQDFWRESSDAARVFYPEVIQQGKPGAFDAVQILLELGAEQAPGIACGSLVPTQDALDKLPQGVESALRQCRLLAGRIWTIKRGGAGAVKIQK